MMKREKVKEKEREIEMKNNKHTNKKKNDKWRNEIIWTGNNIGDSGARMISESLKTNTTLTTLGLIGEENEVNEITKYKNRRMQEG